jgi:Zn-dependent peptidase ImmA (M78 family)
MNEFKRFGSPGLFEIAARWTTDEEPHDRLPKTSGWSMGDLQITVGHQVLTARRFDECDRSYISWYLHPLFDWLIKQWTWLFHEEMYSWSGSAGIPAAVASFAALGRTIGASDETEREEYRAIQSWWSRHALRAADSSALYPDICFRRVSDDVEISWSGRQPVYAPDGLSLTLSPGFATLAVDSVVKPLWEFIQWGLKTAPVSDASERHVVEELKTRLQRLKRTTLKDLESKYLRGRLQELLSIAAKTVSWQSESTFVSGVPAVASLDAAVLMFGGLAPSISERDAVQLLRFLKKHEAQPESAALLKLVDNRPLNLAIPPYHDGYELAEDVREDFDIHSSESPINVQSLLHDLGIAVEEVTLDTDSVRGVAIAGSNFGPAILVNTTSAFNKTLQGRKFTMAHELCHILFDRTRAKKLSHVSGAWTSARVEKRANAFAAMFLASRAAVKRTFTIANEEAIKKQAETLELGYSALIEHLYNLGLIDETERDRLRAPAAGN